MRRIDRGRNTVTQTAREGAAITRPAGMTSDPQTQAVWPEVGWEWQQVTFPFSLLTSSCSDSWNSIKADFLMPQTHTLQNHLIAPTGMLDVILPRWYRCVHSSSLCIYQAIFSRGWIGECDCVCSILNTSTPSYLPDSRLAITLLFSKISPLSYPSQCAPFFSSSWLVRGSQQLSLSG